MSILSIPETPYFLAGRAAIGDIQIGAPDPSTRKRLEMLSRVAQWVDVPRINTSQAMCEAGVEIRMTSNSVRLSSKRDINVFIISGETLYVQAKTQTPDLR